PRNPDHRLSQGVEQGFPLKPSLRISPQIRSPRKLFVRVSKETRQAINGNGVINSFIQLPVLEPGPINLSFGERPSKQPLQPMVAVNDHFSLFDGVWDTRRKGDLVSKTLGAVDHDLALFSLPHGLVVIAS